MAFDPIICAKRLAQLGQRLFDLFRCPGRRHGRRLVGFLGRVLFAVNRLLFDLRQKCSGIVNLVLDLLGQALRNVPRCIVR
jgi:hypothetical protein